MITQLNERARRGIEEDEKRRRKKNAVSEKDGSSVHHRDATSAFGHDYSGLSKPLINEQDKNSQYSVENSDDDDNDDQSVRNKKKSKKNTGRNTEANATHKSRWM